MGGGWGLGRLFLDKLLNQIQVDFDNRIFFCSILIFPILQFCPILPSQQGLHKLCFLQKLGCQKPCWDQTFQPGKKNCCQTGNLSLDQRNYKSPVCNRLRRFLIHGGGGGGWGGGTLNIEYYHCQDLLALNRNFGKDCSTAPFKNVCDS